MKKSVQGFTLVEIMIVVAIIGLMVTMAMPAFVRARDNSQEAVCLNNLRIILTAKEQFTLENNQPSGTIINGTDLDVYMKQSFADIQEPAGTAYDILPAGELPVCQFGGSHTL